VKKVFDKKRITCQVKCIETATIATQQKRKFDMTNAKTQNAVAKAHVDMTVTHDGQTFTVSETCEHISHLFDQRDDTAELVLFQTRDIGLWLLQLRSIYPSNKQFGAAIAATPLSKRSAQDRNDAMFVAENWDKVAKLNKGGELNSLGASAVRKRVKKAQSAGNTSKGKRADKPAEAEAAPITADSLAKATLKLLADNDITLADFRKALTKASKA
jgi:hypothetical protein